MYFQPIAFAAAPSACPIRAFDGTPSCTRKASVLPAGGALGSGTVWPIVAGGLLNFATIAFACETPAASTAHSSLIRCPSRKNCSRLAMLLLPRERDRSCNDCCLLHLDLAVQSRWVLSIVNDPVRRVWMSVERPSAAVNT